MAAGSRPCLTWATAPRTWTPWPTSRGVLANPDNPSGGVLPSDAVAAFFDRLPKTTTLLLDQAYAELAPEDARGMLPNADGRVVCFRTFSKAYGMAGARIGYAVAAPEVVQAFDKVRAHFAVNRVAQAGALASLEDAAFLDGVRAEVEAGRRDYRTLGDELSVPVLPSATNFCLFDFGTRERAEAVLKALTERRVFVRKPGVPPLDRTVRISIGSADDRQRLAEHLRALRRQGVF